MYLEGARGLEIDRMLLGQRLQVTRLRLDAVLLDQPQGRLAGRVQGVPYLGPLVLDLGELLLDHFDLALRKGAPRIEIVGGAP